MSVKVETIMVLALCLFMKGEGGVMTFFLQSAATKNNYDAKI